MERLLGFGLPASARAHPQWWSNNLGSHVAVRAWRHAGWRTSRVDVGGERLVFVRDEADAPAARARREGEIVLAWNALPPAVQALIDQARLETGDGVEQAVAGLLVELAVERRRGRLQWFRAHRTPRQQSSDSADLLREDRGWDE